MLLALALTLSLAEPAPDAIATAPRLLGEFVELKTKSGTLLASLDLPTQPGPWPVVLIHAGSGPTDGDGNGPLTQTNNLKLLGRSLAANGIAALRIDKRGVGRSRNALQREEDVRLETYAADIVAWTAFLRSDPRFTKVGHIGHSEGSLIGLVAAKEAKPDAFVSLCGPGRPLQDILREQLKNGLPANLFEESDKIITELTAGRTVKETSKTLAALFRPSVQPYLISTFQHDPAKLLAALPVPVLVVSGSTDIQVTAEDAKRLGDAMPQAKVVTIDGMNHVLKAVAEKHRLLQLPSYSDPTLPLHPKLVPELVAFLKVALAAK